MFRQLGCFPVLLFLILLAASGGAAQPEILELNPIGAWQNRYGKIKPIVRHKPKVKLNLVAANNSDSNRFTFYFQTDCRELLYASDGSGVANARMYFFIRFRSKDAQVDHFAEGFEQSQLSETDVRDVRCGRVEISKSVSLQPGNYKIEAQFVDLGSGGRWSKKLNRLLRD